MNEPVRNVSRRRFDRPRDWFASASAETVDRITSLGSDIVLVLSEAGTIEDVTYDSDQIQAYAPEAWIGKRWEQTVTDESVQKVRDMLTEVEQRSYTRRRHINHPVEGLRDLPVGYIVVAVDDSPMRIALGADLLQMADMQSRLIRAEIEIEREYRDLRRTEARYRAMFHLLAHPMLVVDGSDQKVVDLNGPAVAVVGKPAARVIGTAATALFASSRRDVVAEALTAAVRDGSSETFEAPLAGSDTNQVVQLEPFRDHGSISLLLRLGGNNNGVSSDLRHAGDRWDKHGVLWNLPEAVIVTDANGVVEELNDSFLDMTHAVSRAQVIGRNLDNWIGASRVDMQVLMSGLRERGEARRFSTIVHDEFGGTTGVNISAKRVSNGGRERFGFLIVESDIKDSVLPKMTDGSLHSPSGFAELVGRVPLKDLVRDASDMIERLCIEAALRQTGNNRASAADMLGLSRQGFYIKLKRHGIGEQSGSR